MSFLVTSVISGILVAAGGMLYVLMLAVGVLVLVEVYLALMTVPERRIVTTAEAMGEPADGASGDAETARRGRHGHGVDIRGTLRIVRSVPGLLALIFFSCFNNFLGGAFMALMDAYGLSMVSVQAWGLLWGALSVGIIVGGLVVARVGFSQQPRSHPAPRQRRALDVTILFPVRSSIVLLAAGMAIYMLLVPFAEAAEQTVLQQVVPYERQGRVFGFAQSVEQAASPLTAFLIGPITQFAVIPFMTDGWGAQHDRPVVRHRPGPRDRPGLRHRRRHRPGRHAARTGQPLLPRPQRRGRRSTERAGRRERVCAGRSGLIAGCASPT